jgi:hypothetical protein
MRRRQACQSACLSRIKVTFAESFWKFGADGENLTYRLVTKVSFMWYMLQSWFYDVLHAIGRLNRHEWTIVFVVALLFGIFCLRGFGSRWNY